MFRIRFKTREGGGSSIILAIFYILFCETLQRNITDQTPKQFLISCSRVVGLVFQQKKSRLAMFCYLLPNIAWICRNQFALKTILNSKVKHLKNTTWIFCCAVVFSLDFSHLIIVCLSWNKDVTCTRLHTFALHITFNSRILATPNYKTFLLSSHVFACSSLTDDSFWRARMFRQPRAAF